MESLCFSAKGSDDAYDVSVSLTILEGNVEEEVKGWVLGECPCLSSYDNDWDDDISDA